MHRIYTFPFSNYITLYKPVNIVDRLTQFAKDYVQYSTTSITISPVSDFVFWPHCLVYLTSRITFPVDFLSRI